MPRNHLIAGRVRDLIPNGDSVVETPNGIVFARGGLIGEQVQVSLDDKPGRIRRGRIVSLTHPSESRVEPPCPYFERCGGCSVMHASVAEQRALYTRFLRDALHKVGIEVEPALHTTEQRLGYRTRARLSFRRAKNSAQLGFHRERSRELIDLERCIVLAPPLERALEQARANLLGLLEGEGELSLSLGVEGRAVVVIESAAPQPPALYTACAQWFERGELAGIALYAAGASKPALFGDARAFSVVSDGAPLEGAIAGFSQAHAEINAALVARVRELAESEGKRVLELYAGSGNFTVALAGGAASYLAVEQSPAAVEALRKNLTARSLTAKLVTGDVTASLRGAALDLVVLDPPRTGAPGVLPVLAQRKPRRIVYVSCDPATLARDLAELLPHGYRVSSADAFEMFPQTADFESVIALDRIA